MNEGLDANTAVPKLEVLNTEERLRKKLHELDDLVRQIRNELLGPPASGHEKAPNPEGDTGFFSKIGLKLKKDIEIVDEITAVAREVQRSFGDPEQPTPLR